MKNRNKGITLIALVVSIIVLLVLAGVSISMLTGQNGILRRTVEAKERTDEAKEKEMLQRVILGAIATAPYGKLEKEELQQQLKNEGEDVEVIDEEENFNVIFKKSKRSYYVEKNGKISASEGMINDNNAGDITKGGVLNGLDKPYEINCIEDLVALSNMVNGTGIIIENGKPKEVEKNYIFTGKKIVLKRNLDFNSDFSYQNSQRTDFGDINGITDDGNILIKELTTGKGFNPIGQYGTEFQGDFDGINNKILNLYEKDVDGRMGLFGCIKNSSIKNLYVKGKIENNTDNIVGGLSGSAHSSNIDIINCIVNININSKSSVNGGFFGNTWGGKISFTNCGNHGDINVGAGTAGGFIGSMESTTDIYNSYNLGNIKLSDNGNISGLSGMVGTIFSNNLNVINSFNAGNIESKRNGRRGGIVGNGERITNYLKLEHVYNLGMITGELPNWSTGKGALLGYGADITNAAITINECYYIQGTADTAVYKKDDSEYGVKKIEELRYHELVQKLNYFVENGNRSDWKLWKIGNYEYPVFE